MKAPLLSLEEQRELLRRREEGWRMANELQAEEARSRSEAEKWRVADELLHDWPGGKAVPVSTSGLVEQQRLFRKHWTR